MKNTTLMSTWWTNDRTEELKKLQTLLNEVTVINHGSGACDRIRQCETIAESLRTSDEKESFIQFLVNLAIKDRAKSYQAVVSENVETNQ